MNYLDRIAYDTGGYTVQEILSSFSNKILEIIDLVNKNEEVCDEAHTIIENIRNEVVPDLVDDILKELQVNGYFDNLVNGRLYNQLRTELTASLNQTITDHTIRLENFDSQLQQIANKGTTVEVLERVTKEEINRQIEDGTIANLTIEDNSITWDKFKNELKSNINQLVINTTINNDGSVKEIFIDNKYKLTTFGNNVINEKWYTCDNNLLFTKTTTIKPDGSISEALV